MKYNKKEFIKLKRRFVNLKYHLVKSRLSGDDPPNDMLKEFADIERTVRILTKAFS